ncbi:MAG: FAD:protein FMN transferase [Clostridiales bacterium]|jgi:thiamine biosynthesis lipoprotein|nr:FAD:protein FMN transferase [Clostridiales bacterium]
MRRETPGQKAAFCQGQHGRPASNRPKAPIIAVLAILAGACVLFALKTPPRKVSKQWLALDTIVSVTIYDYKRFNDISSVDILADCADIVSRYENLFSATIPGSDIYKLNRRQAETVDPRTYKLIEKSLYYSEKTGGLYDVTIAPVSALWDFEAASPALPDETTLQTALLRVSSKNIELLPGNRVRLKNGAQIELGSIAKGFISDELAAFLESRGVTGAIINLGGNVRAVGGKRGGAPFRIGVLNPFSADIAGYVEAAGVSVVTSGVYERSFYIDNKLYHHILSPYTGYPIESDLSSATIVAKSGTDADALSTCCILLGRKKALELAEGAGVQAVFITSDGEIVTTRKNPLH